MIAMPVLAIESAASDGLPDLWRSANTASRMNSHRDHAIGPRSAPFALAIICHAVILDEDSSLTRNNYAPGAGHGTAMNRRMRMLLAKRISRLDIALLITNIFGVVIYLFRVRYSWAIPEEKGAIPITGEPFVWAAAILPIIVVFPFLNVVWGLVILIKRQWQRGRLWLLTTLIWMLAVVVDFAHH